jgi:hypothetical protein
MSFKAQVGGGGALIGIVIVVILVIFVYLYSQGYIKLGSGGLNTNSSSATPVALSASAIGQTTNLYAGESFQIISSVTNNRDSQIVISMLPYGCSTISQSATYKTIPANVSESFSWNFTAPSSGDCQVQFTACFNYMSYANYPITLENSNIANAPITFPSFSNSPVALSIQDFNSTVIAPPAAVDPFGVNQTEYILAGNVGTGSVFNRTLNWLRISSTGKSYIQLSSRVTNIGSGFNITRTAFPQSLFFNGNFALPIVLDIPPVLNSNGYSSQIINISAGYSYCINSNAVPVSVS